MYIYENQSWPKFSWRIEELTDLLSKVSFLQGNLLGKMQQLGFDLQLRAKALIVSKFVLLLLAV